MHRTKNDLSAAVRAQVADMLNGSLAEAIDLMLQAKQAHWNVKGPQFRQLHELFDDVFEVAEETVDLMAERIVQLGGTAVGLASQVVQTSKLPPYPVTISDGRQHVEALSTALAAFGAKVRAAIDRSAEIGDADTADLYTEVSRDIDKYLWMVEAHLEG